MASQKKFFTFGGQNIPIDTWRDWRWQMAHTIARADELLRAVSFSSTEASRYKKLFTALSKPGFDAVRLTPYLLTRIDWENPNDPIRLQHLPQEKELKADSFTLDTIWERPKDFADGDNRFIQQKYPDIVLLRLSNMCNAFCRFCFEKERTLRRQVPTAIGPSQFALALKHIRKHPQIRQVLISGGDPLIIPDTILLRYIQQLAAVPQISTIRINTRSLLHNPFRITTDFVSALSRIQAESWLYSERERGVRIELGVHFNHPRELSPEALGAIRLLIQHGIGVYNQTVLLKGINDSLEVLRTLFRMLREENVRLHYLSHAMPVPGTGHMRTSVATGIKLMRALRRTGEFRGQLPHFETSHFTGKQMVPDVFHTEFKEIKRGGKKAIRFLSDITGKWEVQP